MKLLTAKFNVNLPFNLLLNRDENDKLNYQIQIKDFDVKILLIANFSLRCKRNNELYYTFTVSRIELTISKPESIAPPSVVINGKTKDYRLRFQYFQERLPKYREIALEVLNCLICFFKYTLKNPLLEKLSIHETDLQNPKWVDEHDQVLHDKLLNFALTGIPGFSTTSFGVKKFTSSEDTDLLLALKDPIKLELYEELLSDAQTAIFQNNFRRGILELAIACEVFIKQTFFSESSAARAVYEYLEDKRRISTSVIELLHGASKEAFGESFKEIYCDEYDDINNLFRCRNKIAHRGLAIFKDKNGKLQTVDEKILENWWNSVEILFDWLSKYKK